MMASRFPRFHDDNLPTRTSIEQIEVEDSIQKCYDSLQSGEIILHRNRHIEYLKKGLFYLEVSTTILETYRAWMCYWISLSLNLLGESQYLKDNSYKIIGFLKNCESPTGGYAGGPNQEAHLASTYAAVNALITIGNDESFQSINRKRIRKFLCAMQQPDGSFTLHSSGEIDMRGTYCALAVAELLDIPFVSEEDGNLFENTAQWILSCQTYEGGFGAGPGHEAHGGYTFCAVAALAILNQLHQCDMDALLRWVTSRQMSFEGGFSGRSNKLVDGCYSFWNGAIIPIIQGWMAKQNTIPNRWLFNQEALQEYILICCQNKTFGGLKDKPGKHCDFYHTCYTLSGLSIAQHTLVGPIVIGTLETNLVEPTHPIFNVPIDSLKAIKEYFEEQNNDCD